MLETCPIAQKGTDYVPSFGDPDHERALRLQEILQPDQNSFAVIRLIAALSVLVSHCYFLQSGLAASEPLRAWTGYSLGAHGVQVFFVLSGILVSQSLMRSTSLVDFATARILRIFPALVVCVFATSFLLGPALSTLSIHGYLKDGALYSYLAKTLFLTTGSAHLPQLFSDNPVPDVVNLSLWTLKYEVICYAIVAFVGSLLLASNAKRTLTAATILGWAGLMIVFPPSLGDGSGAINNLHYFLLFFGAGVAAYLTRNFLHIRTRWVGFLFVFYVLTISTKWTTLGAALFLGYAAIFVASLDFGPLRRLANRYDLSYGTYIYGVPASQALLVLDPTLSAWSLIVLTAMVVLPLALLSWISVERPALAFRPRIVALVNAAKSAAWRLGPAAKEGEGVG